MEDVLSSARSREMTLAEHHELVNAIRKALGKDPLYDIEKEEGGRHSTYAPNDVNTDGCRMIRTHLRKAS